MSVHSKLQVRYGGGMQGEGEEGERETTDQRPATKRAATRSSFLRYLRRSTSQFLPPQHPHRQNGPLVGQYVALGVTILTGPEL